MNLPLTGLGEAEWKCVLTLLIALVCLGLWLLSRVRRGL